MWTNEIRTKTKPIHATFKLATDFIVRLSPLTCNGIIKRWLHYLMSVSKERFLGNILMFGSVWCLVMAEIQFSLIKKINKDWTSRTLANPPTPPPPPPTSNNISFLPYHLMFNDSRSPESFRMGKTKCGYHLTYGIAPYFESQNFQSFKHISASTNGLKC